jgi:two-component system phosphate regulon response regulator PhoB
MEKDPAPAARLFVVDDEDDVTDLLRYRLESAGFEVEVENHPLRVLPRLRERRPDLLVLDIMMPELDGIQLCHLIREERALREIPIIFITAKGEAEDRIAGFEAGVDDYLSKPFDTRELILRIGAVLKRVRGAGGGERMISVGPITADKDLHQILLHGETVVLTATEFKLLLLLMEQAGKVLPRDVLLTRVWNYQASTETRTVDTHVRRLREKLGPAAGLIETVRGVGYRMTAPVAGPS